MARFSRLIDEINECGAAADGFNADRANARTAIQESGAFDTRAKNVLSKLKLKSRPYKHLALGHHNYVFSINSLRALGRAANFDIVHHTTTQPAWRSGGAHRLLEKFEMATWCWIVYRKSART